eukprot:TRINITY_DN1781_c1_g2_i1.p1 TRINITY_DN1781_c1_g2~~TRINITY_DN1781_c1_g2_i1.p1  ORF type:complete len:439 (+),score=100.11 TRINITY_DN1781_c1_g2_i1:82-1398(+)
MSNFDAKVLAWAKNANVRLDAKHELLGKSLETISNYERLEGVEYMNMAVNWGLRDDIQKLQNEVDASISEYGGDSFGKVNETGLGEVKTGFRFGATTTIEDDDFVEDDDDDDDDGKVKITSPLGDTEHSQIVSAMKNHASRRKTVSSEVIHLEEIDNFVPEVHEKSEASRAWLTEALETNYLFEHLEHKELDTLISAMTSVDLSESENLLSQGEDGDTFYLIESGTADVIVNEEVVRQIGEKTCLGEEELMYSAESKQTIKTTSPSLRAWALDRQTYRYIVTKASIKKRALYEDFLSNIDFLKSLSSFERLQVADALRPTEHKSGEHIISFGQEGTHFYIIVEGTVNVIGRKDDEKDGATVHVCTFTVGDCVGELEFINKHHTVADVVADGPVKTAKMGRRHFEKVMGPVEEFLKDRANDHSKFEYYRGKRESAATAD